MQMNFNENKFKFPEPYIAKYVVPSAGVEVFNGTRRISGSCVSYKQLAVPDSKVDKLKVIGADGWETFFHETGICQYLLPRKLDTNIESCTRDLKPHWEYRVPFTGNGFLGNGAGPIILHQYLTKEVDPQNGHLMVFYDDNGNIYGRYQFNEGEDQWEDVERFDTWINSDLTSIEPDAWRSLVKSLMKIEDWKSMIASTFSNLFLLSQWKILGKPTPNNKMRVSMENREGISHLLIFTSAAHIKQYVKRVRESEGNTASEKFVVSPLKREEVLQRLAGFARKNIPKMIVNPGPDEFTYEIPLVAEIHKWLSENGHLEPPRFQE